MIDILKALADETRLRILAQIVKDDMCVCEIEACLELTQSNASRHLTILKRAGILENYKKAQWTYYRVRAEFMEDNKELYKYLLIRFQTMNFYNVDCENYYKCKNQDLCSIAKK